MTSDDSDIVSSSDFERASVLQLRPTRGAPAQPFTRVSLADAAAPLRAKHHEALRALAAWSLANGTSCDLDTAALCLEELERLRTPDGHVLLDRPTVNQILWADVWNLSQMLGTLLPEHWHVELCTVIGWLDDSGVLDARSDPLAVLREPLRCYGLLDEDGRPMPEGSDVDFACQCYVPYEPTLPPGIGLAIVGHDPESYEYLVTRARLRPRAIPATVVDLEPLFILARGVRQRGTSLRLHVEEFSFIGSVPPERSTPQLWIYRHDPTSRRGFDPLVVDSDGQVWIPHVDRRRKVGFRWVRASDFTAIRRAGAGQSDADSFDVRDVRSSESYECAPWDSNPEPAD
jgi:hypothetical protein